jgi:serine/threonine protein kinase
VDGESLGQRVERAGAVPEAEAVALIAQVCDGLQRAHKQGLVHRDVKPDNILVNHAGVAKLTDMGLVKEVDNDLNLTKTGRGLGTPHYMAPEQFRNAKSVDIRGDVYSLGATLYALVTGRVPFEQSNPLDCWMRKIKNEFPAPKELNESVSDRVDWAIRRAMSAEPSQRPTSCREFLEDLTGQSRASATPSSTAPPPGRSDVWYMAYKDETGQKHTVKGATDGIRNALKERLLGDPSAILVGRSKAGQFVPIGSVPEFRDLVVVPAPMALPGRTDSRKSGIDIGKSSAELAKSGKSASRLDKSTAEMASLSKSGVELGGGPSPPRNNPPSGRLPVPPPNDTPLESPHASHADTLDIQAGTPTPLPGILPARRTPTPTSTPQLPVFRKKPFDWTPIVLVVIGVLSAAAGYLLLLRR